MTGESTAISTRDDRPASQVEICYNKLKRLIVTCEIAPGERLTEKELIKRLGFGRTPVREALLRLSQEHMIDTMPRSGYCVRPLTRKSVTDFFAVWRCVAPLIGQLAIAGLTPDHRAALQRLGEQQEQLSNTDYASLSRIGRQFFDILIDATQNDYLTYIYRNIGAEMERLFGLFFRFAEGQKWIATGEGFATFANVTTPEKAFALIDSQVRRSEEEILLLLDRITGKDAFFGRRLFPPQAAHQNEVILHSD